MPKILSKAPVLLETIFPNDNTDNKTDFSDNKPRDFLPNKKTKSPKTGQIIYYCNYKKNFQYSCPFYISITRRSNSNAIYSKFFLCHNNATDLD